MATQGQPYDCIDFCREQYVLGSIAKVHVYVPTLESKTCAAARSFLRREEMKQVSILKSPSPSVTERLRPSSTEKPLSESLSLI